LTPLHGRACASVFELSAKGAKHVSLGKLSAERVVKGIRAIIFDETITKIQVHESVIARDGNTHRSFA
jgi:hypothetical protein